MKISISQKPRTDTIICLVCSEDLPSGLKDFNAETGACAVRYDGTSTTIYCGCGSRKNVTLSIMRAASAQGMKKAVELKRTRVALIPLPQADNLPEAETACLEGAVLGAYSFSKYKSDKPVPVAHIEFCAQYLDSRAVRRIETLCACTCYARDLVNDNAHTTYPELLAQEARAIGRAGRIALEVLDEKAIRKKGLGLLWAVGQASPFPPRLVVLKYTGNPASHKTTAVVGKGITFDSGGQNLKTTGNIESMRQDMAGAATVLGLMKAAILLKPRVNIIGVIAAAHNAIGSRAYFPGDIYTSYSGKTVEITSTDAEGRLVLADAFSYVQKKYKPSEIIDFATLTGSVLFALGDTVAGLFSNNDDLASGLFTAGEKTGERVWRLPVYREHTDAIKSDLADLRNTSKLKKGHAGSITGAAFIKEFVQDIPWAHLDIAGTAYIESEARGEIPKHATGFGVRLMWEYLSGR